MSTVDERNPTARGQALLDLGRPKDAIEILRHAAAADPDDPLPRCLLAKALGELERYDEAREAAEQAIKLAPDGEWGHRLHALALIGLGRTKPAMQAADRAAALAPDLPAVHIVRAGALHARGRNEDAEASARRAIELEPEDPTAHGLLGDVLLAAGRPADAAEAYRAALRLDPEDATVHNNLGVAYHHQGKRVWAQESFERAAALDPRLDLSRRNIVDTARHTTETGLPIGIVIAGSYWAMRYTGRHGSPLLGLVLVLTAWWTLEAGIHYIWQRSEEDRLPARTRILLDDERARRRRRPWTWRPRLFHLPPTMLLVFAIPRPLRAALGAAIAVVMLVSSQGYTAADWVVFGWVVGFTAFLSIRIE